MYGKCEVVDGRETVWHRLEKREWVFGWDKLECSVEGCDVWYTQCFWKSHGESLKFSHVIETLHMHLKSNQVWGYTCSVQVVRSDPCQLPVIMVHHLQPFFDQPNLHVIDSFCTHMV